MPGDVLSYHVAYHAHLSEALAYYSELVPRLENRYGTRITKLDSSQLEGVCLLSLCGGCQALESGLSSGVLLCVLGVLSISGRIRLCVKERVGVVYSAPT